jgi:hypothetical protein
MDMSNKRKSAAGGRTLDRVVRCFDGVVRNRRTLTDGQKQMAAELAMRHGHRGLSFAVKVMKDHGLIAASTYDRDCMGVRRALAELRTPNGANLPRSENE